MICEACEEKFEYLPAQVCVSCGTPLLPGIKLCHACKLDPAPFCGFVALVYYQGLARDCIHALKYKGNLGLGFVLAERMLLKAQAWGADVDCVVPVPLSAEKRLERGYNQAGALAKPLAAFLGLPYYPRAMDRGRESLSQVNLDLRSRFENVRGVFKAHTHSVRGRRVLLVDDVFTTGATSRSATMALLDAGADSVYVCTFAKTPARY